MSPETVELLKQFCDDFKKSGKHIIVIEHPEHPYYTYNYQQAGNNILIIDGFSNIDKRTTED